MYRSELSVRASGAQIVDKAKNTFKAIADRRYVLGWDCCHLAVQVNLGVTTGT